MRPVTQEYGGLKALEAASTRAQRAVSDLTQDKMIQTHVATRQGA